MNFTKSQQNAIETRDCSLIVSAGAGSGKTAVLTERILERICDENDDCFIDDFLIVTFTNAAAKELSDRIRKKLSERSEADPGNKKIIKNIARLPLSRISTINSFCYDLAKSNFQKLGLASSVRIADETEMALIRQKLMNEVLDEYFEEKGDDKAFLAAFEIFSLAKNDKNFVETLLDLDNKLRGLAFPERFRQDVIDSYRSILGDGEYFDTALGKKLCQITKEHAQNCVRIMESLLDDVSRHEKLYNAYAPAIESERDFARLILANLDKGYEAVRECVMSYNKVSLKAVRNFEDPVLKDLIKDCKNAVSGEFVSLLCDNFACSRKELELAATDTLTVLEKLFEIVDVFSKRLADRKNELSIMEFSDAERYAKQLLVKNDEPFEVTDLAKSLSQRYKEIYIDEYQDVNPLQDLIFKSLASRNEDGEYSRFMVGDIKQSIYRFRGARSDIFMSYRDTFSDIDTNSNARRIFMSDNFRCAESVICASNYVFSRLMRQYYTEGDSLVFARQEENRITCPVSLCVFSHDKEESLGASAEELEAALIAKKIEELVDNPLYTNPEGKRYTYGDIGILTRSKAALKVFERVLEEKGIQTESDVGESFFGKKETLLCLNILNSIDNPERDIYLAGFMRSFAGGFSDDELCIIKQKNKKLSLHKAVIAYAESAEASDSKLCEKCREFLEKLTFYRRCSRGMSAEKLVWKVYCGMDIIGGCTSGSFTKNKDSAKRNLLKFYQMARDFTKTSFKGIGAFIDYINNSLMRDDTKSEREVSGDCVRLMTIHASKGLEFPICFVSSLSKKFNKSDETKKLVFSEKSGIALTLCDVDGLVTSDTNTGLISINTPYRRLIADDLDREMSDEEIRILYVAMTRARDRLILTGALPKKIQNAMSDGLVIGKTENYSLANNFLSLILGVFSEDSALKKLYAVSETGYYPQKNEAEGFLESEYYSAGELAKLLFDKKEKQPETDDSESGGVDEEYAVKFREIASFKPKTSDAPSKITVSQLKRGLIEEEMRIDKKVLSKAVKMPKFIMENAEYSAADKGTATHLFMQFADFEACETDCTAEADRLYELGFLEKYQREIVDIKKLSDFFRTPFYQLIKNSKKIYREQRFNLEIGAFDTPLENGTLVQGVIDLFFENNDGTYTVVDFKTDSVHGEGAENILIERHSQQLTYYKRAVEEMTGCEVKASYIFSFSLMKEIEV